MNRQPPDLFQKRSATNDFLFSHSDDPAQERDTDLAATGSCDTDEDPLAARFSDMLDRKGLTLAIETTLGSVGQLCVIAARIERAPRQAPAPGESMLKTDSFTDVLTPVVAVCRNHGGIWARIGRCRFAFALPQLADKDGEALARQMQDALPTDDTTTLTAGVAVYPTIDDTRSQVVSNAEKALDHAGFFGPGSITRFDAVSLNISGDRLYQSGDIQGAIDEFKKGLQIDPSDTNLLNSLGVCYGVVNAYRKAMTVLETASRLAPHEVMPVYNQGYILLCQGEKERALECFLSAEAIESDVFEVVFHIGQIHLEAGAADMARPYLESATRANDRSGSAYRHLGACLDQLGLTKEAIQAYKTTVKINPDDAESLSLLGRLYAKRGESLDVASALCEQSVQIDPDNGLFRYRLGQVYLEQGRLNHALGEFELADSLGYDSRTKIEEIQDRMMATKAS